jgi:hypothetical protein
MGHIGSIIAPGARLSLGSAERLLAGVTQENYGRFAQIGETQIKSNHPAFVLGHLALYPIRTMQFLKVPVGAAAFPPAYEPLFKAGVACVDDPHGKIYPPLAELKSTFTESYKAAIAAVEAAPDEAFTVPNPLEGRPRELFPTIGAAISFYLIGHVQVHLGQVSAWRRAMGLPPA